MGAHMSTRIMHQAVYDDLLQQIMFVPGRQYCLVQSTGEFAQFALESSRERTYWRKAADRRLPGHNSVMQVSFDACNAALAEFTKTDVTVEHLRQSLASGDRSAPVVTYTVDGKAAASDRIHRRVTDTPTEGEAPSGSGGDIFVTYQGDTVRYSQGTNASTEEEGAMIHLLLARGMHLIRATSRLVPPPCLARAHDFHMIITIWRGRERPYPAVP